MPSLDFGLEGAHVLISGASGGIGIALVDTFLELGAKVTAQYKTSLRELEVYKGRGVAAIKANVTSEADVARLFEGAKSFHGHPPSVLVINHGVFVTDDSHIVDLDLAQWRSTIAINLEGSFLLAREFLRHLRGPPSAEGPVSIVLIGSTSGKFGESGHGDYSSSKAALMYGFLPTLKNEIVKIVPGGRVNSCNQGWVATPMAKEIVKDEKVLAKALATTPLQKIATPEDVARQVAVLASPTLSGHVTGANIQVDGGMEGRLLYPPAA